MKLLETLCRWWEKWQEQLRLKDLERMERYWAGMTDEKAQKVSFALFYEVGAVESGEFDDEWKRRKGERAHAY